MRKVLIGITPLLFSLAAFGQAAGSAAAPQKPAPAAGQLTPGNAAGAPPPPANPLTTEQAHELMQLTGTDKLKEQLVANAGAYFQRTFPPFMPKDVMPDITTSLQNADIDTPVVAIYKKYLSTDDAAKAIEFYKTPAGKDLIKATPQILNDAQRSAGQTAQQVVKDVMDRHKAEIEAAQKAYQQEHTPPSLGAPTPGSKAPGAAAKPAPAKPAPQH